MHSLMMLRKSFHVSQRVLARQAAISYRSLQLIEGAHHDAKVSTLTKIARAFHYPQNVFKNYLSGFFELPPDSITIISRAMLTSPSREWKILLFDFVDFFRKTKNLKCIHEPPCAGLPVQILALLASTTESLCEELGFEVPWWCAGVISLREPYFVAEVENLKAMALVESPVHFRKRNIFVFKNFLDRA